MQVQFNIVIIGHTSLACCHFKAILPFSFMILSHMAVTATPETYVVSYNGFHSIKPE